MVIFMELEKVRVLRINKFVDIVFIKIKCRQFIFYLDEYFILWMNSAIKFTFFFVLDSRSVLLSISSVIKLQEIFFLWFYYLFRCC